MSDEVAKILNSLIPTQPPLKNADACPSCWGSRAQRYSIDARCNDPFHTRGRVRKGRRSRSRSLRWLDPDENRETVRIADADLTDQDPEERTFGGPGKVIVQPGLPVRGRD